MIRNHVASWRTPISVSAVKRPIPKITPGQGSFKTPGAGSGRSKPHASWGFMASALLQPSLFLEGAGLKVLGFSSVLISLLLLLQKEPCSRNVCKRQRHLPVQGACPSLPGKLHKLPFFSWSRAVLLQRKCLHSLLSANTATVIPSLQFSCVS